MSFYSSDNSDSWNPQQGYTMPMGGKSSTSAVSVGVGSTSTGVSVPMRSVSRSMRSSRAVSLYAPAQHSSVANTQYPIGGAPSNSVASPVYTTSSATMKSFGAGMATGGMSMSGGSVRNNQSPLVSNQSPLVSNQSPIADSQLPVDMYASAYTPLASPIATVGANSVAALPARSGMMSGPRRIGGTGSGWDHWLSGLGAEGGYLYSDDAGNRYYDMALLYEAFIKAQKNGNFPGWTWEEFLAKYFNADGQNKHNVPLSEPWMLLILALGYAAFRFVRSRRRSAVAARS